MIKFYKDEAGQVMYLDDTYLESMLFVIERPATDDDAAAHPGEHAVLAAVTAPIPTQTVSPDGVA